MTINPGNETTDQYSEDKGLKKIIGKKINPKAFSKKFLWVVRVFPFKKN
jgi:hypothetical protein